jgi:hypothetical protein
VADDPDVAAFELSPPPAPLLPNEKFEVDAAPPPNKFDDDVVLPNSGPPTEGEAAAAESDAWFPADPIPN